MARRHLSLPPRERIDARPINSEATQMGVRGAHRGMGGELIGGYMPQADGSMRAFGTKDRSAGPSLGGGLGRWYEMNPQALPAGDPQSPSFVGPPAPKETPTTTAARPAATPSAAPASPEVASTTAKPAREGGLSRWERLNPHAKKPKTGFA